MAKTIGILGGMGPAATIDMLNKIYAHSRGREERTHAVLADIDPTCLIAPKQCCTTGEMK